MIKVAINGFGRIGRLAFRQMFGSSDFEVVAINDLTSPDMLAHLLKYDSVQKRYEGHTIEATEDSIIVDGKEIKIYKEPEPVNLPWGDLDVDVVFECTGFFTKKDKAMAHIEAGAKKVIISAPAGDDVKTIVYGVNENMLYFFVSLSIVAINKFRHMFITMDLLIEKGEELSNKYHQYENELAKMEKQIVELEQKLGV